MQWCLNAVICFTTLKGKDKVFNPVLQRWKYQIIWNNLFRNVICSKTQKINNLVVQNYTTHLPTMPMTHLHQVNSSKVVKSSKVWRCQKYGVPVAWSAPLCIYVYDKFFRDNMLHYTTVGPLARSVQRTELLERQEKWQEKRLLLPLPSLHCFIVNCKRCGMDKAARTDSPILWLDKLNKCL